MYIYNDESSKARLAKLEKELGKIKGLSKVAVATGMTTGVFHGIDMSDAKDMSDVANRIPASVPFPFLAKELDFNSKLPSVKVMMVLFNMPMYITTNCFYDHERCFLGNRLFYNLIKASRVNGTPSVDLEEGDNNFLDLADKFCNKVLSASKFLDQLVKRAPTVVNMLIDSDDMTSDQILESEKIARMKILAPFMGMGSGSFAKYDKSVANTFAGTIMQSMSKTINEGVYVGAISLTVVGDNFQAKIISMDEATTLSAGLKQRVNDLGKPGATATKEDKSLSIHVVDTIIRGHNGVKGLALALLRYYFIGTSYAAKSSCPIPTWFDRDVASMQYSTDSLVAYSQSGLKMTSFFSGMDHGTFSLQDGRDIPETSPGVWLEMDYNWSTREMSSLLSSQDTPDGVMALCHACLYDRLRNVKQGGSLPGKAQKAQIGPGLPGSDETLNFLTIGKVEDLN